MHVSLSPWLSAVATATVAALPATVAHGLPLCEYVAFKPSALLHHLNAALGDAGTAVVPARHFLEGAHGGDLAVIRDSRVYGYLRFATALAGAESTLEIEDAKGGVVALAEGDTYVCEGGWCRSTELTTALDSDAVTESAIRLSQEPSYGLRYVVYGEQVGVTDWRIQWNDRFQWIVAALTDHHASQPLHATTRLQELKLAMASSPGLVPYLDVLAVSVGAQGQVVIRGRVPHDVYDLTLDAARAAGFYDVRPDIIIDSAARIIPRSDDPDLQRCFGW
jgi:hypothetical protein